MSLNNGLASGPRSILYTTPSIPAGSWSRIAFTVPGDVLGTWAINNGLGLNLAIALGANNTNAVSTAGSWLTDAYYTESGIQSYGSATGVFGLQDNAIYVTGVQLERGSLATAFEFRPYAMELALCQRYFHKTFNIDQIVQNNPITTYKGAIVVVNLGASATGVPITYKYPTPMRTDAIVTLYNPRAGTIGYWDNGAGTASYAANAFNLAETGCLLQSQAVAAGGVGQIHLTANAEY
jgi:hypothetical protein